MRYLATSSPSHFQRKCVPVDTSQIEVPTIAALRVNRERLGDLVVTTPVRLLVDDALAVAAGSLTRVWLKEELFQRTGSFKPRGALSVMLDLDAETLARGVTGVSAGNHAISLGYSARKLGTTAKVVMPKSANPYRVKVCRDLGVTIELVDNVHDAFARVKEIEASEGRTFVHPYEGPKNCAGHGIGRHGVHRSDTRCQRCAGRSDRCGRWRGIDGWCCLRGQTNESRNRGLCG